MYNKYIGATERGANEPGSKLLLKGLYRDCTGSILKGY